MASTAGPAGSGNSAPAPTRSPSSSPGPTDAERRQKILDGFKINSMCMRNADTGAMLWESDKWDKTFEEELKIEIPASILQLKAVSREMNFSSHELINNFHLVQSVSLRGQALEEWRFAFGFVIPGSTNTWQCTIESAGAEAMIPAHILSGNVLIETHFYDGEIHISTTRQRVYYV